MRPVLQMLRRVELEDFGELVAYVTDDKFHDSPWDFNASLCVRLGVLPTQDDEIIYAKLSLFRDRGKASAPAIIAETSDADATAFVSPDLDRQTIPDSAKMSGGN
jgi:hypothetical protein